jgi:hypothetical protein
MHLADTARYQSGVFSRHQALTSGMSAKVVRRRLAEGSWVEPANNVYADAGLEMTRTTWQWAAVLSSGERAVVSHRSAAQVWAMPVSAPPRPEVSVPKSSHPGPGPRIKVRAIDVPPGDVQSHHGLPVTSRQRTVVDCLLTLPPQQGRALLRPRLTTRLGPTARARASRA